MIQQKRLLMGEVRVACQVYYRLSRREMIHHTRARRASWPRHMAMTLCREMVTWSYDQRRPVPLPEIAKYFGQMDHTTVIHAIKRIRKATQDRPNHDGHDYEQLRLALLTHKFQKKLPEVWGYCVPAIA